MGAEAGVGAGMGFERRPPGVAVRLLGPFRVLRNGADARLRASRKVRALLAYLVMAPRPVHRASLCAMLWGAANDPRGELRWCLSKIRDVLDDPSDRRVKAGNDWVTIEASTIDVDALWVAERVGAATSGGDLDLLAEALAILGRLEHARCALRAAMAFHPDFTGSRFRAGAASDNPRYLAARERLCDGMRNAGVPEG
jgi:hypothetical protein